MRLRVLLVVTIAMVASSAIGLPAHAAAPANDNFGDAQILVGNIGSTTGSNVDATSETGEPAHAERGPFSSVWYSWTAPPSNEAVEFDTCHSGFDTTIAIYTGSPVDSLSEVSSNDDTCGLQSRVVFATTSGTVYKIAIAGFGATDTGALTLTWAVRSPPPNDDFADAQVLTGTGGDTKGSTIAATTEAGEPGHPDGPNHSVWYRWTATSNGSANFGSCSTSFGTELRAYTGTSVDALTPIAPIDFGTCGVIFPTSDGTEYRIAVDEPLGVGEDFPLSWGASGYRVDVKIKRLKDATFTGDDVYAWTAPCCDSQDVLTMVRRGKSASFLIELENEGDQADDYPLYGCGVARGFKISYFDGAVDVTKAIEQGTYTTGAVASGDEKDIKLRITASLNAKGTVYCNISASSGGPSYWYDSVAGDVRVKK